MTTPSPYTQLLAHVTAKLGRTLESPADFELLAHDIQCETNEYISPTTLKRLFAYIPQTSQPRPATLSLLARYLGYAGYQQFLEHQQTESNFVATQKIKSADLPIGQKILLTWNPDRTCLIEHLGNSRFIVLQSENAKLLIGDQFSATQFLLGQPLTATDFTPARPNPNANKTYIAGAVSGLTKIELIA